MVISIIFCNHAIFFLQQQIGIGKVRGESKLANIVFLAKYWKAQKAFLANYNEKYFGIQKQKLLFSSYTFKLV